MTGNTWQPRGRRPVRASVEALESRTLLSFTQIPQPNAAYTSGTTLIPITIADGATTTSLSDGTETVSLNQTMTAATVPAGGFNNWGSPPNTESSTPRVLFNDAVDTVTLSLSKPANEFGVELQTDHFGTFPLTATFFEGATQVGSISQTVTVPGAPGGSAADGALLFAGQTNQAFTSVVLTNTAGGGNGLAIAQVRYALASATLGITKTASLDEVNPGGSLTYTVNVTNSGPNDAVNAAVSDPLPAGTTFVSDTFPAGWIESNPGVGNPGTVSFSNPLLANGGAASFTITVKVGAGVAPGTLLSDTASASSDDSTTVSATATTRVGGPLTGSAGNEITGIEGSSTGTVLLGAFTDANQFSTAADYTTNGGSVVVNWGDGSAPQTLTAANLTSIGTPTGVEWTINAAHTYNEEGTDAYSVTVTTQGGSATIVAGSAIVADAALTAGPATLLTPNTGVALPSTTVVATFTDGNTFATTADFTASIDWGDGSPASTGVVVATATPGVFDIEGGHTYAKPGDFTTLVTVHDDGGSQVVITGSSTVTDLAVTGATKSVTAVEGQGTGTFALATFTDPNTLATIADVNATLAVGGWGDGTPAVAGITLVVQQIGVTPLTSATNPGAPIFEVLGSHTYAEETSHGTPFPLSVIVTTLGGVSTTLSSPPGGGVTVLDAKLKSSNGAEIAGTEGITTGAVVLGSFTDANQGATVADYTANGGSVVVNWGDGSAPETLTAADLTSSGSPEGVTWTVSAPHTYAEEGTYAYSVKVTDAGGATTTFIGSAIIADAPLSAPVQSPILTTEAATFPVPVFAPPVFSGTVASFTDANTVSSSAADFKATIDWGDGTPMTAGTVVANGAGSFLVTGSHTYADSGVNGGSGLFSIQVFVSDVGGAKLTIDNTASVADNPIVITGQLDPRSDSGFSNMDGITNVTRPNFYGTSEPFSHVSLFATPTGGGPLIPIGQTQAGSDGSWDIVSNLLADGSYTITATAVDQFGVTTAGPVTITDGYSDTLVIDTVGPKVSSVFFDRQNGSIDIVFTDQGAGMNVASVIDAANYSLTKAHTRPGTYLVNALPTSGTNPLSVTAVINAGHTLRGGFYTFTIYAESVLKKAGVQDIAGNALDGEFYGYFPSGNNVNGGDFVARLDAIHHIILPPLTVIGTATPVVPPGTIPPIVVQHHGHVTTTIPLGYPLVNPHLNTHPPVLAAPLPTAATAHKLSMSSTLHNLAKPVARSAHHTLVKAAAPAVRSRIALA
jgi:uncharacterized repeat protein (TIGR01451 family)